jgi:Domain of unknown function (DUF4386)
MTAAWTPNQAAKIAGAAYLLTYAPAYSWLFVYPKLFVAGDVARTASNIVAHTQLFRATIVLDLLTVAGCVILNVALYELLAPVHRSFARLGAFWRLTEQAVYGATTVSSLVVLSVLGDAGYLQAFEPRQLQALARLLIGAQSTGFTVAMLFLCLGSTSYMYVLVKSHYVPKALALLLLAASTLGTLFFLVLILSPALVGAASTAVRALPRVALVPLAIIASPFLAFEIILALWLLVKGVHIPEHT